LVLGKKAARTAAIIFATISLLLVVGVWLFIPSSKKTDVTVLGEKIAVQVIKQNYPGIKYSVSGRVVTLGDETFNEYRIKLGTDFDKTAYQKLNKHICERLHDETAHLVTSSTTSDLNPLRGATGTCTHWLQTT
jgi:hypothetical protein